jgi:pimeloyl-ACP methyl ester carboxylesterase
MIQQQPANNPKNCFSWFLPGDIVRGQGEALSIREMVEHAVATFAVDRRKVFVTGLSAGGAMASVMLATYPEVFAGGAIIAGLPYGCASNVQQAFEAMFKEHGHAARALGDRVRAASRHRGPWPKWYGMAPAPIVKPPFRLLLEFADVLLMVGDRLRDDAVNVQGRRSVQVSSERWSRPAVGARSTAAHDPHWDFGPSTRRSTSEAFHVTHRTGRRRAGHVLEGAAERGLGFVADCPSANCPPKLAWCAVQPPSTGRAIPVRGRGVARQEHGDRAHLLDCCELLVRLLRQQHVAHHLLARNIVGFRLRLQELCRGFIRVAQ